MRIISHIQIGVRRILMALALAFLGVFFYLRTDHFQRQLESRMVEVLEKASGGRVDLKGFNFSLATREAHLAGLTLRSREAPSQPLFRADSMLVGVRMLPLLAGQVELGLLHVERPRIQVVVDEQGRNNFPKPATPDDTRRSPLDPMFNLLIGRLEVVDGELLWNDYREKLDFTVEHVSASLSYERARDFYSGTLGTKSHGPVFPGGKALSWSGKARFTLQRRILDLTELEWQSSHSLLKASGTVKDLRRPAFDVSYQASLDLAEAGAWMGLNIVRAGTLAARGSGHFEAVPGTFRTSGEVRLERATFSSFADISGSSPFQISRNLSASSKQALLPATAVLGPMQLSLLGGRADGRLQVERIGENPRFTLAGKVEGLSLTLLNQALAGLLPGLSLDKQRLAALLTGEMEIQFGGTGSGLELAARVTAVAPVAVPPGYVPLHGRADFIYREQGEHLTLRDTLLETPATRVTLDGDGKFRVSLATTNPAEFAWLWTPPVKLLGDADFQGVIGGPLRGPTLEGRIRLGPFLYQDRRFDGVQGTVVASPDRLEVKEGKFTRGTAEAQISATLPLAQGTFLETGPWKAAVELRHGDLADPALRDWIGKYPVRGTLSASLTAGGTWREPQVSGSVEVTNGECYGETFDGLRARVGYAAHRFEARDLQITRGKGRVSGTVSYQEEQRDYRFELAGSDLRLEEFTHLSAVALPRAAFSGQANFHASGNGIWRESGGPVAVPTGRADLLIQNLVLNGDRVGNVAGGLHTEGSSLLFQIHTDASQAKLDLRGNLGLQDPYRFQGRAEFTSLDLDPLLKPYLGDHITTHNSSAGRVDFSGNLREGDLRRPENLEVAAELSRSEIGIQNVALRNEGSWRARYRSGALQVEEAHLVGKDVDVKIWGTGGQPASAPDASFPLALRVQGQVNLALLESLRPELAASGRARIEATVEGAWDNPQVNGRVELSEGSLGMQNFSNTLSRLNGVLLFNRTGLRIERLTGESGGGQVNFTGLVDYGRRPIEFQGRAEAAAVRMRYPSGVSTVLDARLNLAGNTRRSVLSGEITVTRAGLNSNFDLAVALAQVKQASAAPAGEAWAKSLELFVRVLSSTDIRFESSRTRNLQAEVDLRLRGTLADPALLGRVNILEGQVNFAGNSYTINRGEVNFLNPFRIDPVVNLDVSTRKQQYDISLDFAGPLDKLSVNYRSDPPLPVADIQTLLIFGRTPRSAQAAASNPALTQMGSNTVLAQALNSAVNSRLERFFGASRMKIDPQAGGPETNPAARLTMEQQVAPDVTLTYITNLTNAQQQIVQLEWAVNQRLSILAVRDQNGLFGIDLKWKKRFR